MSKIVMVILRIMKNYVPVTQNNINNKSAGDKD
jgi:hypothetical protein